MAVQPLPNGAGPRLPGQAGGKSGGVSHGKVKPQQHAATGSGFGVQKVGQKGFGIVAGAVIAGCDLPAAGNADPDRILAGPGGAGAGRSGPVDHGHGIKGRGWQKARLVQDETGDGFGIVQVQNGHGQRGKGRVGGNGAGEGVGGLDQVVAGLGAEHFDLGMTVALVAFDQHQIDRSEAGQDVAERGFGAAVLAHQGKAVGRGEHDLGRAGDAVAVGVFAGVVKIDVVMDMLDRRDGQPLGGNRGHEPLHQTGLAGVLPADDAIDLHAVPLSRAAKRAMSSGVLALAKAMSSGKPAIRAPWAMAKSRMRALAPEARKAARAGARATGHRP